MKSNVNNTKYNNSYNQVVKLYVHSFTTLAMYHHIQM